MVSPMQARRESQVMRGQERLKLLMEGSVVQRQAAITLKCMQTLSRVQSQIRSRRIRMSEENQARHKQLLQKHAKELGGLKVSLSCLSQMQFSFTTKKTPFKLHKLVE